MKATRITTVVPSIRKCGDAMKTLAMVRAALVFMAVAWGHAGAADLKVLSAGAAKEAVLPLTQAFARASGHNIDIDFGHITGWS